MRTFNLFAEDGGGWDRENDRDGYRHRVTAIGERLGGVLNLVYGPAQSPAAATYEEAKTHLAER